MLPSPLSGERIKLTKDMEKERKMLMNLRQVKNRVFSGGCADMIKEGMCLSEPVPGLWKKRPADCFFLYALSPEGDAFSVPWLCLGLCAESGKTVFLRQGEELPWADRKKEYISFRRSSWEEQGDAYRKYEALFPEVRSFAYEEVLEEGKRRTLREYLVAFEAYVGKEFLSFYQMLAPEFFDWAKE